MSLPDTWGSDQQDVGGLLDEPQRGEVVDQGAVQAGAGVVVEVFQGPGGGQARESEPPSQPPVRRGADLSGQEPFEQRGRGQSLEAGGVQDLGQDSAAVRSFR